MLQVYLAYLGERLKVEHEERYLAELPRSMINTVQRYKRWEDRQATLFGKLLLKHAFDCIHHNKDFQCLENMEYTHQGKPYIEGFCSFNISHSGVIIVLAVSDTGEVGIDVEKIRPIQVDNYLRYLPELSEFEHFSDSERVVRFYDCWTMKEAVLKGEGCGLLSPLEQVVLKDNRAVYNNRVWQLIKIDCGKDYCCHVASPEQTACYQIEVVNF